MGLLNPSNCSELTTLSMMYEESTRALGTLCKYHKIKSKGNDPQYDINNDPVREYDPPTDINVIFEQSKTLLRGGKASAESSDSPLVAYIPKRYPNGEKLDIVKFSIVEIVQMHTDSEYTVKYDISSVGMESLNPVYWICELTPHRVQVDLDPDTEGVQSSKEGNMITTNVYLNYKKEMK